MSDDDQRIHCEKHGETAATYVCIHLRDGVACGFHNGGGAPWSDAWCDACEAVVQRDGEWTDENSPKLSVLCTGCYDECRALNATVPPPILADQTQTTPAQLDALAQTAFHWCSRKQDAAKQRWDLGGRAKWALDGTPPVLRFYDEGKTNQLFADAVIVGSFSTNTSTWMWSWAKESHTAEERALTAPLATFGEVRGIEKLSSAHWAGEEVDAWEVTQIAAYLLGADAIYRMPMDHLLVFALLRNFRFAS